MNQLRKIYTTLTGRQKLYIAAACIILGVGMAALMRWQRESGFEPLYKSLSSEDASAVVAKLKERGVDFRIADGGTSILVQADRAPEMRLEVAGAGLVRSGRPGFELFDKVNFGVTDFAEQVNFRRALEGELERSVASLAEVEKARVHLTFKRDSVYLESRQPAKASVLVRLKPQTVLSPQNVQAITHLVASAVEGLAPESISVLDMNGNLLGKPRRSRGTAGDSLDDASLEYQQSIERQFLAKINSTLEPLLGAERYRSAVSVDCDLATVEESEELFDPNRSVMSTSQKSEDVSATATASGVPGTASSLPRPTSAGVRGSGGNSRVTESVSYQTSRTVRHRRVPQGVVQRVSVSVLLDNDIEWQGQGAQRKRVIVQPQPERLKSIHDIVAGVIGFNKDRGDQIVVEVLPFEMTLKSEPPPEHVTAGGAPGRTNTDLFAGLLKRNQLIPASAVMLLFFVLGVGAWQFRKYRAKRRQTTQASVSAQPALAGQSPAPQLTPAQEHYQSDALTSPDVLSVNMISEMVAQRPVECAMVLKQWLTEHQA
ncbi:MAG: flagellar M-ring protein FliF [Bryobacterales bacterium]|nr:flagellar M-ring protein FliF [Bryobacterales bacterium]